MSRELDITKKPLAVVTKQDCITGLQASRILAKYGIHVVGFADNPNNFCSRTKTCKQVIATNTSNEKLIDSLIAFGKNLDEKAVIIPCSDDSVYVISLHRKELKEFYNFILPQHEIIEMFMDKEKFYKYCQLHDFPIPATFLPKNKLDLKEIASNMNFPCIIKPPRGNKLWWQFFKEKVLKIHNPQELYKAYDECLKATDSPIVQQWIAGDDSHLFQCYQYYDRNSKPIINFSARKLRQWHIEAGDATLAEVIKDDTILQQSIQIYEGIKFLGIGALEMKKDINTGEYFIIEPNIGRPIISIGIVEAARIPLLYTMYCDALGMPLPEYTRESYGKTKWISLNNDILASWFYHKRGELSFREWFDSVRDVNTFAVLSIRDPLPFVLNTYSSFTIMLKLLIRTAGRAVTQLMKKIVAFAGSKPIRFKD